MEEKGRKRPVGELKLKINDTKKKVFNSEDDDEDERGKEMKEIKEGSRID